MAVSPYRPRNPGHDYYGLGVYLITLAVSGRQSLLAGFVTEFGHEKIVPTLLGEAVRQAWQETMAFCLTHLLKIHNKC